MTVINLLVSPNLSAESPRLCAEVSTVFSDVGSLSPVADSEQLFCAKEPVNIITPVLISAIEPILATATTWILFLALALVLDLAFSTITMAFKIVIFINMKWETAMQAPSFSNDFDVSQATAIWDKLAFSSFSGLVVPAFYDVLLHVFLALKNLISVAIGLPVSEIWPDAKPAQEEAA